jgi:cytochrome P450
MAVAVGETAEIPEIDPSFLPLIVDDGADWRATCDQLREEYEFFRVKGDSTVWFTRYDAVRKMFLDWKLFTANKDYTGRYLVPGSEEPPRSVDLRRALLPMYGPEQVRKWELRMRDVARTLIAQFVDRGEVDFMGEFANYFFPYIGSEMLGAPPEDWDQLSKWEHEMFAIAPGTPLSDLPHLQPMKTPAEAQLLEYLGVLIERKREKPADDFISFVANLEVDGRALTDREVRGAVEHFVLGAAKTVGAHLGYMFKHLAETPDLRRALITDPTAIDQAGEEILRMFSLWGFPRTATRDTVFYGCPLQAGQRVFALVTMTNRDPRSHGFGEVDYHRHPNRHLAFMVGVHQCIGIHWARTARRIAVEEWHRAIPDYRVDDRVRIVEQPYMGVGYHNLPLIWDTGRG